MGTIEALLEEDQISIEKYNNDPSKVFEQAYSIFKNEILPREKRPKLFGKFIYIDEKLGAKNIENSFWHIASIGEDDSKYDMFPCENHVASMYCKFKCNVNHDENFLKEDYSIPCLFRAHKIGWIKSIINLANMDKGNPQLKIWKVFYKRTWENRLLIRYMNGLIDYVLIFSIVYKERKTDINYYKFVTAYPVVLKSVKQRFDKEYKKYIEKK